MGDLPKELSVEIAKRVAASAANPMEDLGRLHATCLRMRTVCSDAVVGQSIPLQPVLWRREALDLWLFYNNEYHT